MGITGYLIRRYDSAGTTVQSMASGSCLGTVSGTTCTETAVPAGTWKYTVTPVAGNWRGAESTQVSAVVGLPKLTLATTLTRTPATLNGTIANYLDGETLRFRLDNASTGTLLAGTVGGAASPAAVPVGGSAGITVTLPAGTSDGAHLVYAVASPSLESDSVSVTVSNLPPPAPTLTGTPASITSLTTASFSFTDSQSGVSFSCSLDGAAYAACTSPTAYSGLADGAHTFAVTATDALGNVSTATSYPWTVDTGPPTGAITFPVPGSTYNAAGYNAGCGTSGTGDVCGTATDGAGSGVSTVRVSIQQGAGSYWNGTAFASGTEALLTPTGTTSWSYPLAAGAMTDGSYTLRVHVTDAAGNASTTVSSTYTIDTVAPPTPSITAMPTNPSTSNAPSFTFSDTEAGVTFSCALDGAVTACTSPQPYSAVADGSHTFTVKALDAATNASANASYTWTVDTTPPVANTTFPVNGSYYGATKWAAGCAAAGLCGTTSDATSGVASVTVSVQLGTGNYWAAGSFSSPSEALITPTGTTTWSAPFPIGNFAADGQYTVRVHVTDVAGLTTLVTNSFIIDQVAPTASSIATANGGATVGHMEAADTMTLTYSETTIDPATILAGWSGASTNVVVQVTDGGAGHDILTVWDAANSAQTNLGSFDTGQTVYVTGNVTFGLTGTPSTMVLSAGTLTVTLGTVSNAALTGTARKLAPMVWTPSANAADLAANPMSTAPATSASAKQF